MMIECDTERLTELAAKLKPISRQSGILSDMYEAADDWRIMGGLIMDHEPWIGLDRLAMQNEEQRDQIIAFHGDQIAADPDFAEIMERGERLIAAGKLIHGDPRGWLGCNDLIREAFAFLEHQYGFVWTDAESEHWSGYVRSRVKIELHWPDGTAWGVLEVSDVARPYEGHGVEDILYMADRGSPLEPPPRVKVATEAEARAVYAAMADLLRRHCAEILDGVPGAFERLVAAGAERERRLTEKNDRLYGPGTSP